MHQSKAIVVSIDVGCRQGSLTVEARRNGTCFQINRKKVDEF